jgi:hypothetical protein
MSAGGSALTAFPQRAQSPRCKPSGTLAFCPPDGGSDEFVGVFG